MFCTKHSTGRINNIQEHERRLRLIQQNYTSDFEIILENANEKSIHQKCIEFRMIEDYNPVLQIRVFQLAGNCKAEF